MGVVREIKQQTLFLVIQVQENQNGGRKAELQVGQAANAKKD